MNVRTRDDRGFTIIEIVVVLLVLGIISAAVVMSSDYSTGSYELSLEVEIIKAHLRYAQARAMNSDSIWGVKFYKTGAETYYDLFQLDDENNETSFLLPGEETAPAELPEGIVVSAVTVYFDEWGRPYSALPFGSISDVNITVDTEMITIVENTGFIE